MKFFMTYAKSYTSSFIPILTVAPNQILSLEGAIFSEPSHAPFFQVQFSFPAVIWPQPELLFYLEKYLQDIWVLVGWLYKAFG